MARNGKIARLPNAIREQINLRLQDGGEGKKIAEWLNTLPEVTSLMTAEFDGQRINDNNLSNWKLGGYREWEEQQAALETMLQFQSEAVQLSQAGGPQVIEQLALCLTARLAIALRPSFAGSDDPAERLEQLRRLRRDVVALRKGDHDERWVKIQSGKLDLALVTAIPETPALSFLTVAEAPVFIALARSDAIVKSAKLNFGDLRAHDWILPAQHVNPYISEMIQAAASAKGIAPPDTHTFTTAEEASALVLAHKGAAFLTRESAWRISCNQIAIRPLAEERLKLVTRLAMRSEDKKRLTSEFVRAAGRKLVMMQLSQQRSAALAS